MREINTVEEHAFDMQLRTTKDMEKKYSAGQREHGGKLWRKPMLKHMWAEIVDLLHYYHTHAYQIEKCIAILEAEEKRNNWLTLAEGSVLNILRTGNEDGVMEEELAEDTWDSCQQLLVEQQPTLPFGGGQ